MNLHRIAVVDRHRRHILVAELLVLIVAEDDDGVEVCRAQALAEGTLTAAWALSPVFRENSSTFQQLVEIVGNVGD